MGISEKTVIGIDEIVDFIPQRAPIVMVDEFFGLSGELSVSGLTIEKENIFCEEEIFGECGIVEHIAQSAAMRMGFICKSENKEVPLGYIGSVNKLKIYHLPRVGDHLRTEIRVEQQIMNISLISAIVRVDDTLVADCQMKIFLEQQ